MVRLIQILEAIIQLFLFYVPFMILAFIIIVGLARILDSLMKPEDEKTRKRKAQLRKYPDFDLDLNRGIENMEDDSES